MINVKNFDIVTPGTLLSDENNGRNGTYNEGNNIYSKYFGMVQVNERGVSVGPVTSKYFPEEGDEVIGRIVEAGSKYWVVDIDAPYLVRLDNRDVNFRTEMGELDKYMKAGELILARVTMVYVNNAADISMKGTRYAKLPPNMIVKVDPSKLPRLIGKEGATINLIKQETNCDIVVGQNGVVWIEGKGGNVTAAVDAVKFIEENYYNPNLTDAVREMLQNVREKT